MNKLSAMPTEKLAVEYKKRHGLVLALASLIVCLVVGFVSVGSLFRDQVTELSGRDTRIRVHSQLLPAEPGSFPDKLLLLVKEVYLHEDLAEEVLSVACVNRIVAICGTSGNPVTYKKVLHIDSIPGKTFCVEDVEQDPERFFSEEYWPRFLGSRRYYALDWTIELQMDPMKYEYYKYPFDHITVEAELVFEGQLHVVFADDRSRSFELPASHVIETRLPGWKAYAVAGPGETLFPSLILRRDPAVRILACVLMALVFLVTAVLPLVDSLGTAVEISVALILGVWGVRQILLPNGAPGPTALDMILLIEYGALALALVGSVVLHLVAMRTGAKEANQPLSDSYRYIGLLHSNVYHMIDCRHVAGRSTPELVKYRDRDHAEGAGKRPCRTCVASELSRIDE